MLLLWLIDSKTCIILNLSSLLLSTVCLNLPYKYRPYWDDHDWSELMSNCEILHNANVPLLGFCLINAHYISNAIPATMWLLRSATVCLNKTCQLHHLLFNWLISEDYGNPGKLCCFISRIVLECRLNVSHWKTRPEVCCIGQNVSQKPEMRSVHCGFIIIWSGTRNDPFSYSMDSTLTSVTSKSLLLWMWK